MTAAVLLLALLVLGAAEIASRWLGLGTPVLYYTAAWGGLRPLPDQHVQRIGGASVTVDRNGFRTAHPEEPDALRVLFIGDSVTWGGSSVDDTAIFSEVSADVLRTQEIPVYAMNAAVNGTSLVNHIEILRSGIPPVDLLVWLFPLGDLTRAYQAGGDVYPARFRPRFALVEAIDLLISKYWRTILRYDISPTSSLEIPIPTNYERFFEYEVDMRNDKNILALRCGLRWAADHDVPAIVGVTPQLMDGRLVLPRSELIDAVGASIQPPAILFDVYGALEAWEGEASDLFLDLVHLSATGHRVVGRALGQKLLEIVKEYDPAPDVTGQPALPCL
jgi:hypothetical protein